MYKLSKLTKFSKITLNSFNTLLPKKLTPNIITRGLIITGLVTSTYNKFTFCDNTPITTDCSPNQHSIMKQPIDKIILYLDSIKECDFNDILTHAAYNNRYDVIKYLSNKISISSATLCIALQYAIQNNNSDIIKLLLQTSNINKDLLTHTQRLDFVTTINNAATNKNFHNIFKQLAKHKYSIISESQWDIIFNKAITHNNLKLFNLIANKNLSKYSGDTYVIFICACDDDSPDIVKYVVNRTDFTAEQLQKAFGYACKKSHYSVVEYMCDSFTSLDLQEGLDMVGKVNPHLDSCNNNLIRIKINNKINERELEELIRYGGYEDRYYWN